MTFSDYVADYLLNERLARSRALVVRDPTDRYRDICRRLETQDVSVVVADGPATQNWEQVARAWRDLTDGSIGALLVYRGSGDAQVMVDRSTDPLASFEAMMGVFPETGKAQEDYRSLAQSAYPEKHDEIDRLFSEGEPSVATLDNLTTGASYPTLSGITGAENAADILVAVLDPQSDAVGKTLATSGGLSELTSVLAATIQMDSPSGQSADTVAEEIWQYLLFSEFVLDLPSETPQSLRTVACAPETRTESVFALCRRLRRDLRDAYIEHAERVEQKLNLAASTTEIGDYGVVDTFAFENAAALRTSVDFLLSGAYGEARTIIDGAKESIWADNDSTLNSTWRVLELATQFFDDVNRTPPEEAAQEPVQWYCSTGLRVDRSYRTFVLSYSRLEDDQPYGADLSELLSTVGSFYRNWAETVQGSFAKHVDVTGWPEPGIIRQDRIFASVVQKLLHQQKRVAYFMVDALRYELGESLAAKLEPQLKVERESGATLLPTKTIVGMAALCPDSEGPVVIHFPDTGPVVSRGATTLATAADRDSLFVKHFGDRVLVETLEKWLSRSGSKKIDTGIRLAVIRSTEIDAAGEQVDSMFRSALENLMSQLARAVRKSFDVGFDAVVVTADHGFLFLPPQAAGDQMSVPAGTIRTKGSRYVSGKLEKADTVFAFDTETLGYEVGEETLAVPKTLATFVKRDSYEHGGLSLQEALIPILTVQRMTTTKRKQATVELDYRGKKSAKVTSLAPTITVDVQRGGASGSLAFDEEWANEYVEIALILTAGDSSTSGGQIGPNDYLDPDTGHLRIRPGTNTTIPLRLDEDHRGALTVDAIDPQTNKRYDSIRLDVDILE